MGRKSSIELLDPRLKGAIEEKLRTGRFTLDDIVQHVKGLGGEVSRSAVGRFAKDYTESMRRYSEAQEVAGRWVQQFQENPQSDIGRLLAEMLKTLAWRTMADAGDEGVEAPSALELSRLARMVKDVAGIDRLKQEIEAKARSTAITDAATKAESSAQEAGLSAERAAQIRREVLGLREPVVPAG